VSIFFELFNPGGKNRTEELRRLDNTREDEGRSEPGRGPIDLSSGKVVIRPAAKPEPERESDEEPGDAEGVDPQA
jgi:hypothetical protein